jgi:hypothetical protein
MATSTVCLLLVDSRHVAVLGEEKSTVDMVVLGEEKCSANEHWKNGGNG